MYTYSIYTYVIIYIYIYICDYFRPSSAFLSHPLRESLPEVLRGKKKKNAAARLLPVPKSRAARWGGRP